MTQVYQTDNENTLQLMKKHEKYTLTKEYGFIIYLGHNILWHLDIRYLINRFIIWAQYWLSYPFSETFIKTLLNYICTLYLKTVVSPPK